MSLIQKKLASLEAGTEVQINYSEEEGRQISCRGIILGKNGSSIQLQVDGVLRQVTLTAVTGLAVLGKTEVPKQETPSTVQQEKQTAPQEAPVPLTYIGVITKNLWVNGTGEITWTNDGIEQVIPFSHNQVKDPLVRDMVQLGKLDLEKKKFSVRFEIKNGRAVNIQRYINLLLQAQNAFDRQKYDRVVSMCRQITNPEELNSAFLMMIKAAGVSKNPTVMREAKAYYDANQDRYPTFGKAKVVLGRLYWELGEKEKALELTAEAMEDQEATPKIQTEIRYQYLLYLMQTYQETGDPCRMSLAEKLADEWLKLRDTQLLGESHIEKQRPSVLRWRTIALACLDKVEEAEACYNLLVQKYPTNPGMESTSQEICRARERRLERENARKETESAPVAEHCRESEEIPVWENVSLPPVDMSGSWEDLGMTEDTFVARIMDMKGPDRLGAQITALKAGAMLNPNLKKLWHCWSLASGDPLEEEEDFGDTQSLVRLLSGCDERYPVLHQYCVAAGFLRSAFRKGSLPLWLRQNVDTEFVAELAAVWRAWDAFRKEEENADARKALCRALMLLARTCECAEESAEDGEGRTAWFLLGNAALDLLEQTRHGRETGRQVMFLDFLNSNHVALDDTGKPDFSGILAGWNTLGLVERVFAHADGEKLEPQAHIDRIFSRDRLWQNFDVAEGLRRLCGQEGIPLTIPDPAPYVRRAEEVAGFEFAELDNELNRRGDVRGRNLLRYLYVTSRANLRFGDLAQGMEQLRQRLEKGAEC